MEAPEGQTLLQHINDLLYSLQGAASAQEREARLAELEAAVQQLERQQQTATAHQQQLFHELRNLQQNLLQVTQNALDQPTPADQERSGLAHIAAQAQHLQDAFNLFLGQSRSPLQQRQWQALQPFAEALLEPYTFAAQRKQLQLYYVLKTTSGRAWYLPLVALRHILQNLVSNALRHTHEGEVALVLEEQPDALVFRVQDTGPGLSAGAEGATGAAEAASGGWGLLIANQLARALGATFELRNRQDRSGAVATLTLPAADLEVAQNAPQGATAPPNAPPLLFVSPHAEAASAQAAALRRWGWAALPVTSLPAALKEALGRRPVPALLVELAWPPEAGLLHFLREFRLLGPPLLWGLGNTAERYADLDRQFSRPILPGRLHDALRQHWQAASAAAPAGGQSASAPEHLRMPAAHSRTASASLALVAEDDPFAAASLQMALEKHGLKVLLAEDGLSAWRMLKRHQPALLILDWQLPQLSGREVLAKLTALRTAPVVFLLSAETIDTATWPRARHKPQQILQKPFPLKQMGRMLEAAGLATAAAPDASAYPLLTETAPKHAAAERLPVYGPSAAGGDDAILPAWPEPTSLTERLRLDDTVLDQLRALLPLLEHALRRAGDGVAPLPWAEGLQQLRRYFQAADAQALILTLDHQAHLLRQAQHQGEHAPFEALARYLARWQALLNQAP